MDSFSVGIWQVIILGFFGVLSPAIVALIAAVMTRKTTLETWARQDRVAQDAAMAQRITDAKIDTVHMLVNSNMTAAKQSEYDAMVRDLASMTELASVKQTSGNGKKPTKEILDAIATSKDKIAALRIELDERQKQAKVIGQQEAARLDSIVDPTMGDQIKVEVVEGQKPIPVKIKE